MDNTSPRPGAHFQALAQLQRTILARVGNAFKSHGYKFVLPDGSLDAWQILEGFALVAEGIVESWRDKCPADIQASAFSLRALANYKSWVADGPSADSPGERLCEAIMRGSTLGAASALSWAAEQDVSTDLLNRVQELEAQKQQAEQTKRKNRADGGKAASKKQSEWHWPVRIFVADEKIKNPKAPQKILFKEASKRLADIGYKMEKRDFGPILRGRYKNETARAEQLVREKRQELLMLSDTEFLADLLVKLKQRAPLSAAR